MIPLGILSKSPPPVFYNQGISGTFYKNDCGNEYYSEAQYITIGDGQYSAPTQGEANSLAYQAAQNQANSNGSCILGNPRFYLITVTVAPAEIDYIAYGGEHVFNRLIDNGMSVYTLTAPVFVRGDGYYS